METFKNSIGLARFSEILKVFWALSQEIQVRIPRN